MVVINIDTAKDSKEEIRKTINYLQALIGEQYESAATEPAPGFINPLAPDTPDDSSENESVASMMNMFGDDAPSSSEEEQTDAASLIKESGDDDVEVVDEQQDAFIEIVEY